MNLLAIDASSDNLSLALMWKGKLVFDYNKIKPYGSSNTIEILNSCFKKITVNPKNIDALVLGKGPGSFTGLRVSFSIVKGLSFGLDKPVISMGSFFSCAYDFKDKERIAVVSDARRGLIYMASFKTKNGKLELEGKEKLAPLKELLKLKKGYFFLTYTGVLRSQIKGYAKGIKLYPKDP